MGRKERILDKGAPARKFAFSNIIITGGRWGKKATDLRMLANKSATRGISKVAATKFDVSNMSITNDIRVGEMGAYRPWRNKVAT